MPGPQTPEPERPAEPLPVTEGDQTAPETGPPPDEHPVTDRYVARRLANDAAARAERERQEVADATAAGEALPQSAFAFYVLLGIVISLLLLVVIFQTPEPTAPSSPGPQRGLTVPR